MPPEEPSQIPEQPVEPTAVESPAIESSLEQPVATPPVVEAAPAAYQPAPEQPVAQPAPQVVQPTPDSGQAPAPIAGSNPKSKKIGVIISLIIVVVLVVLGFMLLSHKSVASPSQAASSSQKQKTDLLSIRTKLEAVYATDSAYPSLDQLNRETWRYEHMQGLDPLALSPNSSQLKLVASSPTDSAYAYAPSPSGCSDATTNPCKSYLLSAKQAGAPLTFKSLN